MTFGKRRDPAAQDTQTVARVRGALEGYLAAGGPGASVSVRHLLDLLNPRGMWSLDPDRRKAEEVVPERQASGRDPFTGCAWPGAPGTTPPGI